MSESMWYTAMAGQQQGPMSKDDLVNKIRVGEVKSDTLVFCQGVTDNWKPVREVAELASESVPPVPPAPVGSKRSHEIDFEVFGEEMQFVEIELDPSETVVAEAGAMMFMEDGIEMEAKFGDGSEPDKGFMSKLFEGAKRKVTGESLFMTWFTNRGHGKKHVSFGAPYPGKIIALDLSEIGGQFICQKDAFLCAALGTKIGIAFNRKLGAGFFGGEGFIMQSLSGDGKAFVHAGGTIVRRTLRAGETLRVDTGCIVGFTSNVNYDIQRAGNMKSMFFGGEGFFLATLSGPGEVWLQSLPFSRLADRIYQAAPQVSGSRSQGEGSVLGGLGDLLGGD